MVAISGDVVLKKKSDKNYALQNANFPRVIRIDPELRLSQESY